MEPAAPRRAAPLLPSTPQPLSPSQPHSSSPEGPHSEQPAQQAPKPSDPQPPGRQTQNETQTRPPEAAEPPSTFGWAEQAEIVRSAQKDEYYCQVVQQSLTEAIQLAFGSRVLNSYKNGLLMLSDLLYYSLTSLMGLQTLGEEYTDIRQVVAESETPPELSRRVAFVLWKVVLPYCAQVTQAKLVSRNRNLGGYRLDGRGAEVQGARARLGSSIRSQLVEILPSMRSILSSLQRLHLAWFYMKGFYFTPSHRLAGLKLMSLSAPRIPQGDQPLQYSILGKLIVFQEAVRLWMNLRKKIPELLRRSQQDFEEDLEAEEDSEAEEQAGEGEGAEESGVEANKVAKCMLCLGDRRRPTATSCGHVFCWTCIVEWAGSKPECPLCRQSISVQSLLRLYHYQP